MCHGSYVQGSLGVGLQSSENAGLSCVHLSLFTDSPNSAARRGRCLAAAGQVAGRPVQLCGQGDPVLRVQVPGQASSAGASSGGLRHTQTVCLQVKMEKSLSLEPDSRP